MVEKDVVLDVCRRVQNALPGEVALTRRGDEDLSLRERIRASYGARSFVSVHADSGREPSVWLHPEGSPQAQRLGLALAAELDAPVYQGRLATLNPRDHGRTAAAMVELGDLREPQVAAGLGRADVRAELGRRIARGLARYGADEPNLNLGDTNVGWGVCGFTSSFYALHSLFRESSPNVDQGHRAHRVLAEIKTYLRMLQAAGETAILDGIVRFTKSFGLVEIESQSHDFSTTTIENYIARINASVNRSDSEIRGDLRFGLALPPSTVVDYLSRMWSKTAVVHRGDKPGRNGIVGVSKRNDPSGKPFNGLVHYLYRYKGEYYSWGRKFSTLRAANAQYQIRWFIEFDG